MARDLALERAWRKRMRQYDLSGLTIREFCEQQGLVKHQFSWWRAELKRRAAAAKPSHSPAKPKQPSSKKNGQPTTTLLAGATYLKDNRLLPAGFDKGAAPTDIAVYGAALDDADFGATGDTTRYTVALDGVQGPFTITVELLYQSIGFRWADNLGRHDAPEPARFVEYYEQVPNQAVVIASATLEVGE